MDLASVAGPAASLITALGALPLAALLQNRREMRVRNSIENNIKIINDISGAKLANEQALITTLESGLQSDVSALVKLIESRNQEKKRNWASLFVAIFLAAIITIPLWLLWRPENGWTWALFILLATVATMLLIGGLSACFTAGRKDPSQV